MTQEQDIHNAITVLVKLLRPYINKPEQYNHSNELIIRLLKHKNFNGIRVSINEPCFTRQYTRKDFTNAFRELTSLYQFDYGELQLTFTGSSVIIYYCNSEEMSPLEPEIVYSGNRGILSYLA